MVNYINHLLITYYATDTYIHYLYTPKNRIWETMLFTVHRKGKWVGKKCSNWSQGTRKLWWWGWDSKAGFVDANPTLFQASPRLLQWDFGKVIYTKECQMIIMSLKIMYDVWKIDQDQQDRLAIKPITFLAGGRRGSGPWILPQGLEQVNEINTYS